MLRRIRNGLHNVHIKRGASDQAHPAIRGYFCFTAPSPLFAFLVFLFCKCIPVVITNTASPAAKARLTRWPVATKRRKLSIPRTSANRLILVT